MDHRQSNINVSNCAHKYINKHKKQTIKTFAKLTSG